jgi:hypothetical protein
MISTTGAAFRRRPFDRMQHVIPLLFGAELVPTIMAIGVNFFARERHNIPLNCGEVLAGSLAHVSLLPVGAAITSACSISQMAFSAGRCPRS